MLKLSPTKAALVATAVLLPSSLIAQNARVGAPAPQFTATDSSG